MQSDTRSSATSMSPMRYARSADSASMRTVGFGPRVRLMRYHPSSSSTLHASPAVRTGFSMSSTALSMALTNASGPQVHSTSRESLR